MSAAPDDGLDALLASLLAGSAPAAEPEPVAEPAPAPVVVAQSLPELPTETVKLFEQLRAKVDAAEPGAVLQLPMLEAPAPEREPPLDPEALLEVATSRAWYSGDQEAFEKALARLPADRAAVHKRLAGICEMARLRHGARTQGGGRS
jgi:hypothetical protein